MKWCVTEIFFAALPPTEDPEVQVLTFQGYASVLFLGITRN